VWQESYPTGQKPTTVDDYGLLLQVAAKALVPMPLAGLIHERLTATVAKGRHDLDWAGFARDVSENAGL
jgi:3-hydroxyisobutyrate dehydrogenase-like beta-hydroxyacid dehydrogenase